MNSDDLENLDVTTQADDPIKLMHPILSRLAYYRTNVVDPRVVGFDAPVSALLIDRLKGKTYQKVGPQLTDWIEAGSLNLSNTVYADSNAKSDGDGSPSQPFKSLQAAIDAAELLGKETRKVIFIAPGSAFDEDVVVTGGLMEIMGLGPWTLGDGVGSAFNSTTPRSFTYNSDGALTNGKWPALVLGTIMDDEASSTHTAYLNAATISGDFIFNETHAVSHNLQMRNVKVQGNFTQTGAGGIQTYLRRCFFDNLFTGSSVLLNIVDSCQFDQLVTCAGYARVWQCEFRAGLTTGALLNSLPPNGMFETNFKGVFTGPAASLLLDPVTNYFFNLNAATLAGGATRVLAHDLNIV